MLKDLLNEAQITTDTTTASPLRVQIYCDMDGVLVDMDKGFKALSGGYTPDNFKDKFNGDKKVAQKEFWKIIARKPDFWISLEPMPDAKVLWNFIEENFKDPVPVILSAGQGSTVVQQKTEWIRKHISQTVKVLIAPSGVKKPEFILNHPVQGGQYVTHVLVDDMSKNMSAWNDQTRHRIGIKHTSAAESIKALQAYITK
jgi:hypothetical protein